MQTFTTSSDTYNFKNLSDILHLYNNSDISDFIFFDIETTGFSARNSMCYLIGCTYYENGSFIMKQFFADMPSYSNDEKSIICEFLKIAENFKYIVHFNGDNFDIPYLKERMKILNIKNDYCFSVSIDLFKAAKSLSALLKLENYKQKTVEQFLGICREDTADGGILIPIYKKYLADNAVSKDSTDELKMLLLHNHDDVYALPVIASLLSYKLIKDKNIYTDTIFSISDTYDYDNNPVKEITFSVTLPYFVPVDVSYHLDLFYIKISNNSLKLRTKIHEGSLKYFFNDYRNYYYLPDEDYAIHKSVAAFVDKSRRIPAKAATCYSKKHGQFIAQTDNIFAPVFKNDYKENISYFEAGDNFYNSKEKINEYMYKTITALL